MDWSGLQFGGMPGQVQELLWRLAQPWPDLVLPIPGLLLAVGGVGD